VTTARADFERWRRAGAFRRYRGHSIFHRDEGRGPALLLIHGFPSASWDFHAIWGAVTARFRAIAADMIGFGWSDKPRRHPYSIVDQATLHEELLASLGVESVHVLAHDYGDTVAQELLARYEDRRRSGARGVAIRSICLLNGGLFPETHRARPIQRVLASPLGPLVARFVTKPRFASGMRAIFGPHTPPSEAFIDELWTLLRFQDGHLVGPALIGYMAERRARRARWVGALEHATIPIRAIVGAADPVSGAHMAARYRELVPDADIVLLPEIGHYPQVEDPEAVLDAFWSFHARLDASRA
jgi:pimeloyl-ACP methyl ester carboxylesterase